MATTEREPGQSVHPGRPAQPGQPAQPAQPERSGLSVRNRIVATLACLVALSMTGAGLIIWATETNRIEQQAHDEADQELQEFRKLQKLGRNPTTAKPFRTIAELQRTFLARNVPGNDEMLIAWVGDRPRFHSANDRTTLVRDSRFGDAVTPYLDDGGRFVHKDPARGRLLVTVQPVRREPAQGAAGAEDRGALVVVIFLDDATADLHSLLRDYAVVCLILLALITALGAWVAGRLLRPLRDLNATARAISATDLSRRLPVRGNDDITALTRTFNAMLDRLQGVIDDQRVFLDDAGHELRTPITVLAGHLEVLDPTDPEEVASTRDMLLDETDRMAGLVRDLILLSKSRRPDFLRPREIDLDELTTAVQTKARGLGERVWTADAQAYGSATLDPHRITQALLQLAQNAVAHTGSDAEIGIGSAWVDGDLHLWVRDTGPGVAAEDRERIFERFGRGAGEHPEEGFGLGLSLVTAIATAHDGRVRLTDEEPHGARFTLVLPADGPRGSRPSHPEEHRWQAS